MRIFDLSVIRTAAAAGVLTFAHTLHAGVVEGQSRAEVIAVLGEPIGEVILEDRAIWFFDRGELTLRDDRVSAVNLRSEEEHRAAVERRRAAIEREQRRQAEAEAALEAEGRAILARRQADEAFHNASGLYQLTYWRQFQQRYPMVPIADELALATARYQEEERYRRELAAAREAEYRRLEAESRISDAERRAAEAESEARHLQRELNRRPVFIRTIPVWITPPEKEQNQPNQAPDQTGPTTGRGLEIQTSNRRLEGPGSGSFTPPATDRVRIIPHGTPDSSSRSQRTAHPQAPIRAVPRS
ncbi:MAG: hypothetical protein EA425_11905 [Puniceicoccaceae bacterium]|nr:MAG: hypothetical protein EA425_11905 [Puniceicoccaceae bacterium]